MIKAESITSLDNNENRERMKKIAITAASLAAASVIFKNYEEIEGKIRAAGIWGEKTKTVWAEWISDKTEESAKLIAKLTNYIPGKAVEVEEVELVGKADQDEQLRILERAFEIPGTETLDNTLQTD